VSAGLFVWQSKGAHAREAWWMPVVAGGACAVGSGVLFGVARADDAKLRSGDPSVTTPDELGRLRSAGSTAQTASVVLAGAALVGVGSGLVMKWVPEAHPSVAVSTNGVAVMLGGPF
jgi:hypothetical protein